MMSPPKRFLGFGEISILLVFVSFATCFNFGRFNFGQSFVPGCTNYFPGTDGWNQCWAQFHQGMNTFQQGLQNSNQQAAQSVFPNVPGASNLQTNGYTIQTKGITASSSSNNGKMDISLTISEDETIKTKVSEHQLDITVEGTEGEKFAKIRTPDSVKAKDLKTQRGPISMIISGASTNSGTSSSMQSSSSNSDGNSFSSNSFSSSSSGDSASGLSLNGGFNGFSNSWLFG